MLCVCVRTRRSTPGELATGSSSVHARGLLLQRRVPQVHMPGLLALEPTSALTPWVQCGAGAMGMLVSHSVRGPQEWAGQRCVHHMS